MIDVIIASSWCPSILYRFQMITATGSFSLSSSCSHLCNVLSCFFFTPSFSSVFQLDYLPSFLLSVLQTVCTLIPSTPCFSPHNSPPSPHLSFASQGAAKPHHKSKASLSLFFFKTQNLYLIFIFTTSSYPFMVIISACFFTVYSVGIFKETHPQPPTGGACLP